MPELPDCTEDQLSSRPSGNCQSKYLYIACATSRALENVADPSPVNVTFCRRYLKQCTGILYDIVVSEPLATYIAIVHLGLLEIGGKSFNMMIPCMLKTASSITRSLSSCHFNKCQLFRLSISLITNLSKSASVVW